MWKSQGYILRSSVLNYPMNTSLLLQVPTINFSSFNTISFHSTSSIFKKNPTLCLSPLETTKVVSFHQRGFKLRQSCETLCFHERGWLKNGVLLNDKRGNKRVVLVKSNEGFGYNDGDKAESGDSAKVFGNLALAIGLAYLSLTGQLGWILDAIVSIWIFAVVVPMVGIGAFLWWAGRDIMQGSCPNCGNAFQAFKSLNDDLQLCPFCGLPFSVVGNEFVKESVKFSNQSTTFGDAFNNFSTSKNGKDSIRAIDVEAEIKDVD